MLPFTSLPQEKILQYLGYQKSRHTVSEKLLSQIQEATVCILKTADLRKTHTKPLPLIRKKEGIYAGTLLLEGRDIAAHLEHCTEAVFLAVTLGAEVDALLRTAQVRDMAQAVVLDAAANVAVEAAADYAQEQLREYCKTEQLYLTERFSPGYGDLPLTLQSSLLQLCGAAEQIGLSQTESGVLIPKKSITGVLGLSNIPVKGKLAGCQNCVLRSKCVYRKRGTTCYAE